jgi:dUTP pyrophosphatase
MRLNVKVKKLHPDAVVPFYATSGAAGFDLVATEDAILLPSWTEKDEEVGELYPVFEPKAIGTGLAFEIPPGYELEIRGRSGLAFKHNVLSFNGTIDADYRGEVKLLLYNMGDEVFFVSKGDRVAQGIIKPIEQALFREVTELSDTDRGVGGFGSTGVKA